MKRTKKFYLFVILLLAVLACIFALTACDKAEIKSKLPSERVEGNCTVKGYTRYFMPNGSYFDDVDDDFGEHSYTQEVISVLSCTVDGRTKYTCSFCNDTYYEDVPSIGHVFDEETISVPTCTSAGLKRFSCKNCDHSYEQSIDALPHDYVQTAHTDATCTQAGHTDYKCKNCNATKSEPIDKLEHNFLETARQDSTCTQAGYINYKCKNCEATKSDTIEKKKHSYAELERTPATCTQNGRVVFRCSVCGDESIQTLNKINHAYSVIEQTPSTCTQNGRIVYKCSNCDDIYEEISDKLGHEYKTTVTSEPTCTHEGLSVDVCKHCGHTVERSVPTVPHTPSAATSSNSEGHWHPCTVCGGVCGFEAHSYSVTQVPSTCIEHAYTHNACNGCEYAYDIIDENSALSAHDYDAYLCLYCKRDQMQEHLTEFHSKGSSKNELIEITSPQKLIMFYDFLVFYEITEYKLFKVTYIEFTEDTVKSFFSGVSHTLTATNWTLNFQYFSNTLTKEILYFAACAQNSDNFVFDEAATVSPDQYDAETYVQYQSYQFVKTDEPRSADFDGFKYKNRSNSISVSSSDQLFFAFEHGYRPLPQSGSKAQDILDKAKTVARGIMSDSMSDVEKLKAIYTYLVSDVAYDQTVIKSSNQTALHFAKCTSYYAEGVFDYGIAVCDGIAKAFCILAGLEDIICLRIVSSNHAWNRVYVDVNGDGNMTWQNIDATWANQGIQYNDEYGEYLILSHFLFTDAQKAEQGQVAQNYTGMAEASVEENPFEHFYFDGEATAEHDYVIESDDELTLLIAYLKDNFDVFERGDKVTVQIFIPVTYCERSEINATISYALRNNWIMSSNASLSISDSATVYNQTEGHFVTLIFLKFNT